MEKTLLILNRMVKDGIIDQYAIGGAVAAIFYIEPINTNDLDIFFPLKQPDEGLDFLAPIYEYLARLGYSPQGEAIDIEGWPVQFLPVFNPLLDEAVNEAKEVKFHGVKARIMQAEHLMAIMLQTGRLKDMARLAEFAEQEVFDQELLNDILIRHGLSGQWDSFRRQHLKK